MIKNNLVLESCLLQYPLIDGPLDILGSIPIPEVNIAIGVGETLVGSAMAIYYLSKIIFISMEIRRETEKIKELQQKRHDLARLKISEITDKINQAKEALGAGKSLKEEIRKSIESLDKEEVAFQEEVLSNKVILLEGKTLSLQALVGETKDVIEENLEPLGEIKQGAKNIRSKLNNLKALLKERDQIAIYFAYCLKHIAFGVFRAIQIGLVVALLDATCALAKLSWTWMKTGSPRLNISLREQKA